MQLCFFGTESSDDASRHANSIVNHLQQDLAGNLCKILQASSGSSADSQQLIDAVASALQVSVHSTMHLHPCTIHCSMEHCV
jgi:hypothetical protein